MIAELVDVLDHAGELCDGVDPPLDPADGDAVLVAAMRLGVSVLGLAQRILAAQAVWDATQANRRPYPPPGKPKPPDPPPKPKPGGN